MARWKHGLFRLCHGHARPGKELFWSSRYAIFLGCLWYVISALDAIFSHGMSESSLDVASRI